MIESMTRYWQRFTSFVQRRWNKVKGFSYGKVLKALFEILEVFPGLMAWAIEVLALGSAAICVWQAAHYGYELALWQALGFVALAGTLIGIAILSDHYTRPSEAKHGGGD